MPLSTSGKRLSWNSVFPAPYESIWSILHKVVVLNRIPLEQLVPLIARTPENRRASKPSFVSSSWIDFGKFSALLGVDEHRLIAGTWEGMGIRQPSGTKSSMRQCPRCAELCYHSVLFNIDSISHCPLHKCELTSACVGCGAQSTFGVTKQGTPTGCRRCSVIPSTLEELLEPVQDEMFRRQIGALGDQFVSWWREVGARFPDRDLLLADLLRAGDLDVTRIGNRGWQLHQALRSNVSEKLDWEFRLVAEPVLFSTILNGREQDGSIHSEQPDCDVSRSNNLDVKYRSVRRHIYKNYLSRHKHCYAVLKGLNFDEQHMLNGDNVCPVALAYVIWRMGSENFVRVAGLSKRRKRNPGLRLIGLTRYRGLSDEIKARCAYFSFFGILRQLRLLLGNKNLRIQRYDDFADSLFHFGAVTRGETDTEIERLAVLYPDIRPQATQDFRKCIEKIGGKDALIDLSWSNLGRPVRYPLIGDEEGGSTMLFQIRHMDRETTQSGFVYLSV